MEYDVFISHASEDKVCFVEPLANALRDENGLNVWYDRFALKLGDSLRDKIDQGLARSKYGVVVLSKAFFSKEWPKTELDALVTRQNSEGKKVILPIWHEVSKEDVENFSPILASKVAVRSSDGIKFIVNQILSVISDDTSTEPVSVFQTSKAIGLREKCLYLIRQGDLIAWRSLVEELSDDIAGNLLKWKDTGEKAINECRSPGVQLRDSELWRKAVYEAIKISIPGVIPILAAIQAGKEDYWQESTSFLRRLALLEGDMGGGTDVVLEIGYTLLYVAGSLGFGLISKTKQLGLVNKWSNLVLPRGHSEGEVVWGKCKRFNYWYTGITGEHNSPYAYFNELNQTEDIDGIIGKTDAGLKYLFSGNLFQSMLEFACDVQKPDFAKQIASNNWRPYIMPIWCLMAPDDFRKEVWRLFDSPVAVLKFWNIDGGRVSSPDIWPLWKAWKGKCADFMSEGLRYGVFDAEFLYLPGEPQER